MLKTLDVKSNSRLEMIDITAEVRRFVADSGVREGLCVVMSAHTTAAITVNENADPDVCRDLSALLEKLAPANLPLYRHAEGNSDAHGKLSLIGPSLTLIVTEGAPLLGTWQGVYFCEFDGPRRRQVWLKALAG